MSELVAIQKQLRIKAGVVQRYEKEASIYRQEIVDLKKKMALLVSEGGEEWDIKNAKRMIDESEKMVLDTESRLNKAAGELKDLVKQVEGKPEVAETNEFTKAQQLVGTPTT